MAQALQDKTWIGMERHAFWVLARQHWVRQNLIISKWSSASESGDQAFRKVLANSAHQAIEDLGEDFKKKNRGKYIVMSYEGKQLAIGNSIQEIRSQLKAKGIHGNAVIERIGFDPLIKLSR